VALHRTELQTRVVFSPSFYKNVYAIDALSGKQKWAFPTNDKIESSPTLADDIVYIGSNDDHIYAIDAQSGKRKWTFHTDQWVASSPVVANNVVYVGSWDGNLYAFGLPTPAS
jgi:glucose dehydrogenase